MAFNKQHRVRAEVEANIFGADGADLIAVHARDTHIVSLLKALQRTKDRIVLDNSRHYIVARLEETVNRQLQKLGAVEVYDNSIWTLGSEQAPDCCFCFLKSFANLLGFRVACLPY